LTINKISLLVKDKIISGHTDQKAPPCVYMRASYMAECAVIIPFFAGFMALLLFFFQALLVQQEVGNAMLKAGREMAAVECETDDKPGGVFLAKAMILLNLSEDSPAEQFVKGGRQGISMVRSDFSGDYISLRADYKIKFPIGLFGKLDLEITQKLKCRKWTGKKFKKSAEEEIVFITKKGSVYHRKRDCTYLKPNVTLVNGAFLAEIRNADGGKYYSCIKCMKNKNPNNMMVYVAKYGDRCHSNPDCSRIKRTALAVRLSEVKGWRACSKCGKE